MLKLGSNALRKREQSVRGRNQLTGRWLSRQVALTSHVSIRQPVARCNRCATPTLTTPIAFLMDRTRSGPIYKSRIRLPAGRRCQGLVSIAAKINLLTGHAHEMRARLHSHTTQRYGPTKTAYGYGYCRKGSKNGTQ